MLKLREKWFILTTLCVYMVPQTQSLMILELLKLAEFTFSNVYHTWELAEPHFNGFKDQEHAIVNNKEAALYLSPERPAFYYEAKETKLINRLMEIHRKILELEERMKQAEINLMQRIRKIPKEVTTEIKINQVMDIIKSIEARYETFISHMHVGTKEMNQGKQGLDKKTVINFAEFIVSQTPESPMHVLDKLHSILVPHLDSDRLLGTPSFFQTFQTYLNSDDLTCDVNQSPQQLMFNLYTTFQLTQLKAYTMIHFSWMLLRLYEQGNFEMELGLLNHTYSQRMAQQAEALSSVINKCRNDLWACDPSIHTEGSSFTKITRFLQGYVVNEVDLNTDNTCRENCAFYSFGKQEGCFKNQFCARQPVCKGNIVGCSFVDSDMLICQSPHFSERRYDWIKYENGRSLGQSRTCSRAVEAVDSWWRYLFWHCSYCFCYCDDPQDSRSDRYFNLRPVTADTANNKVITGLRFVKINRIIHLQIQQGEMMPHAEINETSVEWLPVDEYKINDEGVTAGKDYHMLTWEHRAFDLDDLFVKTGQVLTGIKIRRLGGHMNIEIQGADFNYTTGKLTHNGTKTEWYSNDNTDVSYIKPRTEHTISRPDVPNKSLGQNKPDSKPDTFVKFTPSDADFDAAQTTIPFIDIQTVAPNPSSALVGAGVFHKGRDYSGGYLAPKVFTYNQGDHLLNVSPEVINETDL